MHKFYSILVQPVIGYMLFSFKIILKINLFIILIGLKYRQEVYCKLKKYRY